MDVAEKELFALQMALHNKRWQNEIDAINEASDEESDDEILKKELEGNIKSIKKKPEKKKESKKEVDIKRYSAPTDMDSMYDEISKHIYNKPWSRLKDFYKLNKLKEYVNSFDAKESEKKKLISLLEKKLAEKTLKCKQVTYDHRKTEKIRYIDGIRELNDYQKELSDSEESEESDEEESDEESETD